MQYTTSVIALLSTAMTCVNATPTSSRVILQTSLVILSLVILSLVISSPVDSLCVKDALTTGYTAHSSHISSSSHGQDSGSPINNATPHANEHLDVSKYSSQVIVVGIALWDYSGRILLVLILWVLQHRWTHLSHHAAHCHAMRSLDVWLAAPLWFQVAVRREVTEWDLGDSISEENPIAVPVY